MSHLHVQIVGYLGAYRTVDKDIQVEVLVAEGIVPSEGPFWQWRTDVGLIILINLAIFVDVLVLQVTYVGGVGAIKLAGILPRVVLGAVGISGLVVVVLLESLNRRTEDIFEILIYSLYYVTVEAVE